MHVMEKKLIKVEILFLSSLKSYWDSAQWYGVGYDQDT